MKKKSFFFRAASAAVLLFLAVVTTSFTLPGSLTTKQAALDQCVCAPASGCICCYNGVCYNDHKVVCNQEDNMTNP